MNDGDGWLTSSEGRKVLARTESIADVRKSTTEEGSGNRLRGGQERRMGRGEMGIQNMAEKWGVLSLLSSSA